jgi:hypothetical protein
MKIKIDDYSFEQTARVLVVINPTASRMGYDGVLRYMKNRRT